MDKIITRIKKVISLRCCKECMITKPIIEFPVVHSKNSPNARRHICIDCEIIWRRMKNQSYYAIKTKPFRPIVFNPKKINVLIKKIAKLDKSAFTKQSRDVKKFNKVCDKIDLLIHKQNS